jgi:hypothetical protein
MLKSLLEVDSSKVIGSMRAIEYERDITLFCSTFETLAVSLLWIAWSFEE